MRRVVVDPNVLISAVLTPSGPPGLVTQAALARRFTIVGSPHLLAELSETLKRPKFRRYVSTDQAAEFVDGVAGVMDTKPDTAPSQALTGDPKDDYIVLLARQAGADAIVSGDPHLLEMPNPDPPVLSPSEFLDQLGIPAS